VTSRFAKTKAAFRRRTELRTNDESRLGITPVVGNFGAYDNWSVPKSTRCMLTGKPFRLQRATLSMDCRTARPALITIPAHAVLRTVSARTADGLVDVLWEGRRLSMFAVDIERRGIEIKRPDVESSQSSNSATA
jgi:hypothetical protein